MWKRKTIPEDQMERFAELRKSPVALSRSANLMPAFDPGGFRQIRKAISRIRTLSAGTKVELLEIKMKHARAWYRVRVHGTAVEGWLNSIVFEGLGICH